METAFDPKKHAQLMAENEEYRKGYQHAANCISRVASVTPEDLRKMAFIFLDFAQLNAAGMAYCYWELGNTQAAA
ncbi:hypothetical protein [Sporomusa malonica]|uniref:Uncharacterized protein n=1 Tax=Sporomusa malonica TaxID=112901 RepID=A0A1W2ATY5_9FIRM|nr:hypothetical protein [Sporomusa malonica]SMC64173.1 hypothetical protein SAMN04488500_106116 [Sporomusa malonica]